MHSMETVEDARKLYNELSDKWWKSYCLPNGSSSPETTRLKADLDAVVNEAVRKFAKPAVPGCRECEVNSIFGGPGHSPSQYCRSGKRPHCTCDTCF